MTIPSVTNIQVTSWGTQQVCVNQKWVSLDEHVQRVYKATFAAGFDTPQNRVKAFSEAQILGEMILEADELYSQNTYLLVKVAHVISGVVKAVFYCIFSVRSNGDLVREIDVHARAVRTGDPEEAVETCISRKGWFRDTTHQCIRKEVFQETFIPSIFSVRRGDFASDLVFLIRLLELHIERSENPVKERDKIVFQYNSCFVVRVVLYSMILSEREPDTRPDFLQNAVTLEKLCEMHAHFQENTKDREALLNVAPDADFPARKASSDAEGIWKEMIHIAGNFDVAAAKEFPMIGELASHFNK